VLDVRSQRFSPEIVDQWDIPLRNGTAYVRVNGRYYCYAMYLEYSGWCKGPCIGECPTLAEARNRFGTMAPLREYEDRDERKKLEEQLLAETAEIQEKDQGNE
jgi:hypothetical protein